MSAYKRRVDPPEPLQAEHISAQLIREDIWRPAVQHDDWSVFVVVGREGSGKSLTCASILSAVSPDFSVDHTHFKAVPFLEDVADEDQPPGTPIMGDEIGNAFGKRTWHDREQIEANQVLQTARDGNKIIGMTLPRLEELDSQLEGRVHVLVEMDGVTPDDDHAIVKWKRVNPSRDGRGEIRTKFPRKKIDDLPRRVKKIRIGLPPGDFIPPYQEKKQKWKGERYGNVIERFKSDEEDDSGWADPQAVVADIIDRDAVTDYIAENGSQRYVDKDQLAYDYGLGSTLTGKAKSGLKSEAGLDDVM